MFVDWKMIQKIWEVDGGKFGSFVKNIELSRENESELVIRTFESSLISLKVHSVNR